MLYVSNLAFDYKIFTEKPVECPTGFQPLKKFPVT